jgi:hypothetical protein
MCYKTGCAATDSTGCGCGCDCSDDGVNFYGAILDSEYHALQVSMGNNHTSQYHYAQTICAPTNTVVTVAGTAILDNTCACQVGYHNKISTTTDGIVTESCTTCPAGSTCAGGAAPAVPCPAGYTCAGGAAAPAFCPAGYYTNTLASPGASTITQCPVGSTCAGGAAPAVTCPAGYTCAGGAAPTVICPAGSTCAGGANPEVVCPAGSYTDKLTGTGASIATLCAAGSTCAGGTAGEVVCPAGSYTNTLGSTGASIATACAAGSTCAGGTAGEVVCPAGYYTDATQYLLQWGRANQGMKQVGNTHAIAANANDINAVRCCSDVSKQGYKKRGSCTVWGESDAPTCEDASTWTEAVAQCDAHGARLCTEDELAADCTKGTGCGFDKALIWSSTPDMLTGTGASIATACAAGSTCAGGTAGEVVCPAGYKCAGGAAAAIACAAGTYQANNGTSTCTTMDSCVAGSAPFISTANTVSYTTLAVAQTVSPTCEVCDTGTYSDQNSLARNAPSTPLVLSAKATKSTTRPAPTVARLAPVPSTRHRTHSACASEQTP